MSRLPLLTTGRDLQMKRCGRNPWSCSTARKKETDANAVTGVGLAWAERVAKLHGGRLLIESAGEAEQMGGSSGVKVSILLPMKQRSASLARMPVTGRKQLGTE